MEPLTLILYVPVVGFWFWCARREGGIGVGIRFMYVFGLIHQFLVGPPLYFLSGLSDADPEFRGRDAAVQLVLCSFAAFTVGAYVLPPILLRRRPLKMTRDWLPFTSPRRLEGQWQAGKALVIAGMVAQLFAPVMFRFNTVRAVWSQVTLLIETGLVLMCLHAMLAGDRRRLQTVFLVVVGTGVFRAVATGFFGGTAIMVVFLLSLIFLARRSSLKSWGYLALTLYLMLIPYGIWISGRQKLREAISMNVSLTERVSAFELKEDAPLMFNLFDPNDIRRIQLRIDQSHMLAAAMKHTPARQPYGMGATMIEDVLIALVPRFLWPSKPIHAGGHEFVARYTGMKFHTRVSIGINYLFEYYVNFGPVGTVIGLLLLGILCGLLEYQFFEYAPRSYVFEWTAILCSWSICMHSDRMSQLAMTLPVSLFTGWLMGYIFRETQLAPVYYFPSPGEFSANGTGQRPQPADAMN